MFASSPIATATFIAYLNQLFCFKSERPDSKSSVGSPSDIRKIAGATEPEGALRKPFLESLSLSSRQACPKSVTPSASTLLH